MSMIHETVAEPNQSDELFAAFANTLEHSRGVAQDAIPDVDALLGWLHEHGLISDRARASEAGRLRRDPAEGARRLERFRLLRQLLHHAAGQMAAGGHPDPEVVEELNHILKHGLHYHQIRREDQGSRYGVAQVGDRLDQARATIASSFAYFLAGDAAPRLRVCANEGCRWIFVDRSPTGRRRWCDMRTCGNQAKVARHRARAKADAGSGQDAQS
jgi:predicted RNA-binding Zn ribbon-like protein